VLTIAVINHETPDLTAGCVRSIRAFPPTEPFEAIVVDNGSSEETLQRLREIDGARIVETGRNAGFAAGVNRCVSEAAPHADVIVVLNSDTEVEAGALDALAAAARGDRVGLAAPMLRYPDGTPQRSAYSRFPSLATMWATLCIPAAFAQDKLERIVGHASVLSLTDHDAGVRPLHVMGAAMALRRAAWDEVGPFDERYFMYLEETDWQERLHARGWNVELVPSARVVHLHRGGDGAPGVPPLTYLDSTRLYFSSRGVNDWAVRATMATALFVSLIVLLAYRPFSRWAPSHREIVEASIGPTRRALAHATRGRTVPRPG
jgi:GT2 family glycosyltransferase